MLPFISKGEDMRKLETPDLFGFVRLINKLGLKEDIKKMGLKASENVNPEEFGADLIFLMLEKSSTEEGEAYIYEFFAPIFEISEEDIKKMDPIEFLDGIMQVAELGRWKSFFKSAAKWMK